MLTLTSPSDYVAPFSNEDLSKAQDGWISLAKQNFPMVDDIPWLLPNPMATLAQARARADILFDQYAQHLEYLKSDADDAQLLASTRARVKKVRNLHIRKLEYLKDTLQPLAKGEWQSAFSKTDLGYSFMDGMGLLAYFRNITRDWCHQTNENDSSWSALQSVLPKQKFERAVVLGAGACRLAYDFHQKTEVSSTVAMDLNPVYLLTARKILDGNTIQIPEITYSPKSLNDVGLVMPAKIPSPLRKGMSLAFADGYFLPLRDRSVDVVITPWVLDVLPKPTALIAAEIHRVLKVGGYWLNTGSLNFLSGQPRNEWLCEEIEEMTKLVGFDDYVQTQIEIPYLHSPMSAQRRYETVTNFCCKKTDRVSEKKPLIQPPKIE